jgi:hypothetical protein
MIGPDLVADRQALIHRGPKISIDFDFAPKSFSEIYHLLQYYASPLAPQEQHFLALIHNLALMLFALS